MGFKAPEMKVTKDFTKEFNEIVSRFKRDAVLVGIPRTDDPRENEEKGEDSPIGNAAILAINHFGSEASNIKPFPVLTIGIQNAQEDIAEQFGFAAKDALSKGVSALNTYYERAGTIAANSCKKVIVDQEGAPEGRPLKSTLNARKYLTKAGFKGQKLLLVTGQLRNAITYVVKSIWGK